MAGVLFFMDDAISVELLWAENGGRCLHVSEVLGFDAFSGHGGTGGGE